MIGVAAGLTVAATVAILLLVSRVDRMVIAAVETYGSAATGTEVRLRGADVSLRATRATLDGLTIANPPSFDGGHALEVDAIHVDLALGAPGGGVIVLREVTVDGASLHAEQRDTSTNLNEILAYMEQSDAAAQQPQGEIEAEPRIIIDRFTLRGGRVALDSELSSERQHLELPEVVVTDVGRSSGGLTFAETAEVLLEPILAAGRAAVRAQLQDAATRAAKREFEEAAEDKLDELLDRD